MSATFEVILPPATLALQRKMQLLPQLQLAAIARGMNAATQIVMGQVIAERLTGQGPFPVEEHKLGVVSGQLRQSVYATEAEISGDTVTTRMGSPLRYARVHEFGFNGQVHVGGFTRRQRSRDVFAAVPRTSGKTWRALKPGRKKIASGVAGVGDHTRWMQIPARAPFGSGIADHAPIEFPKAIGREVATAWEGRQ